ncbi:astacin-like [Anopheles maculipalpis]|uniref:astacin-like n=1 Tax=Anopheles maculipalpis TaxID=1496333 RepID=UPI00215916D8|nr:astacin-like [Anopheles maculipalpis]
MEIKPFNYLMYIGLALCFVQFSLGLDGAKYTRLRKEVGKRLKSYYPKKSLGYPQEYGFGYYYQGDILLSPSQKGRFAITTDSEDDLWPNATVPYEINANFTAEQMQTLEAAFAQFENNTCVRFVPRTNETRFVNITNVNAGCAAHVGRLAVPYVNNLNLQTPGCMWQVGTPVHEMMHTLGFLHEHSRPDRDEYIIILYQNLAPFYQNPGFISGNLDKDDIDDGTDYGVPYNYGSVMHYSRYAAAISRQRPVLVNKQPYIGDFGNTEGLSAGDVAQLMARYC